MSVKQVNLGNLRRFSSKAVQKKTYFFEISSPPLVVAIFLISGFYLTINNYVFDHSNFPNIMSPGITVKTSG